MSAFQFQLKRFLILGLVLTFYVCFTTSPFAQFSEPQSSGQLTLPLGAKAHLGKGSVSRMQYSPDNKHLVVPTWTGIVWIYETETYQLVSVLEGHPGQVSRVEFSSDSKRMLSGVHGEGIAYLWDTQTWQLLYTFRTTSDRYLRRFWFSADDKSVMMQNSFDDSVDVWDVETGVHIENLPIEDAPLTPSMPSPPFLDDDGTYQGYEFWHRVPNSDMIAAWSHLAVEIHLFNVNTGERLHSIVCCLVVHPGGNSKLYIFGVPAFSPDGRHVAIAGEDGTIRIFDVNNGNTIFTGPETVIEGYAGYITSIAFSPDGQTLATDSTLATLWDIDTQTVSSRLSDSFGGTYGRGMAFSPDGEILALAGAGRTVSFIDVNTGLTVRTIDVGFSDVVFSPDLKICAGFREGSIYLVDTDTGVLLHEVPTPLTQKSFGVIINNETGEAEPAEFGGGRASISVMAFSPDGRMLAGGAANGWILIYDVQTGEQLYLFQSARGRMRSLAFSPDGRILAGGNDEGIIRLWETTNGTLRRTIAADKRSAFGFGNVWDNTPSHLRTISPVSIADVWSLAFSPDGNVLVSGDGSADIDFWDVESGEHLQVFRGYGGRRVIDLAFSPDGNTLASAIGNSIVLLWEYDPLNFTTQPYDPRDVNDDGVINILDLVRVAKKFGERADFIQHQHADVNDDGVINILDLVRVASGFQS